MKRSANAGPAKGEDRTLASSGERPSAAGRRLPALAVGALSVVFGDIGTSPLYAFKQCFLGAHAPHPETAHVLDVCSLIVWALVGVVCIKYVGFVLRADHQGVIGVIARYGFMEQPKLADVVRDCERNGSVELRDASYFVPDPRIERARGRKRMWPWRRALFAFMLRNQQKLSDTLSVPPEQIVHVGIAVPG